jgi:hypothetical protein
MADGNLTPTGSVKYGSERAAAESAVSGLTGVRAAALADRLLPAAGSARPRCLGWRRFTAAADRSGGQLVPFGAGQAATAACRAGST